MHSQLALTEHASLNLALLILLYPVGSCVPYSEFTFYAPAPWQAWNRSFGGTMPFHIHFIDYL